MSIRLWAVAAVTTTCFLGCESSLKTSSLDGGYGQGVDAKAGSVDSDNRGAETAKPEALKRAKQLIRDDNLKEAVALLKKQVSRSPNEIKPRLMLSAALLQAHKNKEAEDQLKRTIERWPDDSKARLLMGYCLSDQKKPKQAIEQFERVLDITEDAEQRISADLGIASLYEDLGEPHKAGRYYADAIAIEPQLRNVLVEVQKELLWQDPTVTDAEGIGRLASDVKRRERIRAELEKLTKSKGQP